MTLVEVVVSMSILGLLSVGILSTVLQIRRAAESSVRESNANAVALGFLEQLQGMDYTLLAQLAATDGDVEFVVRDGTTLSVPLNAADFTDPPLAIPISVDKDGADDAMMDFWLHCAARPSSGGLPATDLNLRYRWLDPTTRLIREGQLLLTRARTQN